MTMGSVLTHAGIVFCFRSTAAVKTSVGRIMAYVSSTAASFVGKKVGNGQCVVYVQTAAKAPVTSSWRKGAAVRNNHSIRSGTAIATFNSLGTYSNDSTGNHAAIYIGQDSSGIWVYDQWVTQGTVKRRTIHFRAGVGSPSNDGDTFSVIE